MIAGKPSIDQLSVHEKISLNARVLTKRNLSPSPYLETLFCVIAQAALAAGFMVAWQCMRFYGWSDVAFLSLAFCGIAWFEIFRLNATAVVLAFEIMVLRGLTVFGIHNFNPWQSKLTSIAWAMPFIVCEVFVRVAPGYAMFLVVAWYFNISPVPPPYT